jgi:hypothetical protein
MARTTIASQIRVRLFDGPHHGRILLIPANQRMLVLPNPMPAGEMFAPGRTNPAEFSKLREVTYVLRQPRDGGDPYLSYVPETRPSFTIPQPAAVKISYEADRLVSAVTDAGYNYGIGSNGTRSERMVMLRTKQLELVKYIARLEREAYPSIYQGTSFTL